MLQLTTHDGLEKAALALVAGKEVSLSEKLQERAIRMKFIHDEIQALRSTREIPGHKIRREVCLRLSEQFSISLQQSYTDFETASTIFGLEEPLNKKELAFQIQIKTLMEDMEECRVLGDMKSLAQMHKTWADLNKNMPQTNPEIANIPFPKIVYDFNPARLNSAVTEDLEGLEEMERRFIRLAEKGEPKAAFLANIAQDTSYEE